MYAIPSMDEIRAIPYNGYTVASLFSGAGGSSLGYRWAGFKVVYANEFTPEAYQVYRTNFPETFVDTRDIRTVQPADIMDKSIGELDILDGSPPCASFSTAGVKSKGWNKEKKYSTQSKKVRVDDLFYEYARILKGIQPKVFVAENVSGLVKGEAKGCFIDILKELRSCGYEVQARLLDAKFLGVPQRRPRLIFVGVRNDLVAKYNVHPIHPKPEKYVISYKEAVESLTNLNIEPEAVNINAKVIELYKMLPRGEAHAKHFNLRRCSWNEPTYTVCQSGGDPWIKSVMHPEEPRKFSIAELKRVCGFPDDFILSGTYKQQWERLGRAVPPPMMYRIARHVQYRILAPIPRSSTTT